MTPTVTAIHRVRWRLAALRVQLALLRCRLAFRAYNPGQPRVPAGSPTGGRWTSGDDGGTGLADDDARLIFVGSRDERSYGVRLDEEEDRGGHTLREHVGKTDADMMQRVRRERWQFPIVTVGRRRDGSFDSQEAANDFVNRTLEGNAATVDAVADGRLDRAFIKQRFGYRTGREAYRSDDDEPHMRDTYGVGVEIRRDPQSLRGYRVHTAYPRNDGD